MISAKEALERLRAGNRRFVASLDNPNASLNNPHRRELLEPQAPFAIILGCSDARVPAEIVFDQGLGDLFVIRVAGNIVAPSQIGSIEFAASKFGTKLVVVMGHTECGAVQATIEQLQHPLAEQSRNLRSIVDRVKPSVIELFNTELRHNPDTLLKHAVRSNVRFSVAHLRHGSEVLEDLERHHGLVVIGAEYSLKTGVVEFFDDEQLK